MEMINSLIEAVFISFLVGAIMGGVVVAHFVHRSQPQQETQTLKPVKIRSDRDEG